VHHHACGLVDHEHVLVLPGDAERDLLARQRSGADVGNRQLELLAALEPVGLRPALAVDDRPAVLQQSLGRGARADLRQRGEEAIKPLARGLGGDGDPTRGQRGLVSPISSAANRIATPTTMKLSARLKAGQ
jgi:hypothetical protein